ncbi:MAG TPA: methyltransferase [Puia sp.]|jgi:tRNA1Val (adenine37-N6)-methyltransferase
MPNPYFQFKQFTIYQDQCAMKVCTDACILGAWFSEKAPSWSRILDIGSGTGLLMLMLAQKHKGEIQGIELDLSAFRQLQDNIRQSPWKEMLKAVPGDARTYSFAGKFEFIIANPPFYEGDLAAGSEQDNLAKHSKELTLSELLPVIDHNLTIDGTFGLLLPYHRTDHFETLAAGHGFYLREKLLVRQTPRHEYFRSVVHFSRRKERFSPLTELTIKDAEGRYTPEFAELMQDYYLPMAYSVK